MTHFKDLITEAAAPRWAKILKNLDKVVDTNESLSNKPELDLAWYGSSYKGAINYGINKKGTIYKIPGLDFKFATRFNSLKEFEIVYFVNDNYDGSERITVSKLTKDMLKAGSWKTPPYYLLDQAVTTLANITGDDKKLTFHFKNGATYEISFGYYNDLIERKGFVQARLEELDKRGIKASAMAKKLLPTIAPSMYGKQEFKLDNSLRLELDKVSKEKLYLKFVNKMSPESRTGWGVSINEREVLVHGMIGNMSSGYRSERFPFKRQPKTFAAFKKHMIDSGAVGYIMQLSAAIFGEMEAYADYMRNGGAVD